MQKIHRSGYAIYVNEHWAATKKQVVDDLAKAPNGAGVTQPQTKLFGLITSVISNRWKTILTEPEREVCRFHLL